MSDFYSRITICKLLMICLLICVASWVMIPGIAADCMGEPAGRCYSSSELYPPGYPDYAYNGKDCYLDHPQHYININGYVREGPENEKTGIAGTPLNSIPVSFYFVYQPYGSNHPPIINFENLTYVKKIGTVLTDANGYFNFKWTGDPRVENFGSLKYNKLNAEYGWFDPKYSYLVITPEFPAGYTFIGSTYEIGHLSGLKYTDPETYYHQTGGAEYLDGNKQRIYIFLDSPSICSAYENKESVVPLYAEFWALKPKDLYATGSTAPCGGNNAAVNFIASPQTGAAPSGVQFTDISGIDTQYISSWEWDFGDGQRQSGHNSTDKSPYHTYTKPGEYTVSLTISGKCPTMQAGTSAGFSLNERKNAFITVNSPPLKLKNAENTDPGYGKDSLSNLTLITMPSHQWEGSGSPKEIIYPKDDSRDQKESVALGTGPETGSSRSPSFIPDWLWSAVRPVTAPIMTFFSGSPTVEPQNHFEPVANPASGAGDSSLTLINPTMENSAPGPGSVQHNFGPAAGNTGSGDIAPVPQGDTTNVFLPEGGGPVSTTPTPVPAPQVFVPIVTIAEDRGAAPVVEVVTPQGGYKLAPGLRANCTVPLVTCSGACVDLTSDVGNCGACGSACPGGYTCSGGMCVKVIVRDPGLLRR